MGVDLGLKVPAVAVTDDDKVLFFWQRQGIDLYLLFR
ncbi:hypothetical protein J2S21_000839 [Peribacillus cavernae]|nr:hypothetical protein [Peribacillus cavernae]